jgi:hypothetical protein
MTLPDSTTPKNLTSLRKSRFRLTQEDRDYIATKALKIIKAHSFQFINCRVAPDFPKNGGTQTPIGKYPALRGMPPPHVSGAAFKSDMESRRSGR